MEILYKIGIRGYGLGVMTAGLLGSEKAVKWVEGRRKWRQTITEKNWKQPVWIHASSLGEFEQAKPLIEKMRKDEQFRDKQFVVTFFSPSGYEYSKNYDLADEVLYLPLDTKGNARFFVATIKPCIAIFVKYDFWFNFLSELQNHKIPILYFSSNFREQQFFFKKSAAWQRKIMRKIDFIYCLNKRSQEVLIKHNFGNSGICGDTRFDRVAMISERTIPIPLIEKFHNNYKTLVLGSSWPPEEKMLAKYLTSDFSDELKIIIAPHDISEQRLVEIESLFERGLIRYSKLNTENATSARIVLVDNIGLLANIYKYGDIAFVGGGFTNDLHNILEPSAMSNALLYGDVISKYPEGKELCEFGGSYLVADQEDFNTKLNKLINNPELLNEMKKASKEFVFRHKGATEIVYQKVKELLS